MVVRMHEIWRTVILFVIIAGVLLLAVGFIDGNRFVTVKEEFRLPGLARECRFVLISDLHNKVYGDKNDKVIGAIREINPDFIVVAGDLVTARESEDITPGVELLRELGRDYTIYYGLGNHESKIKKYPDRFDGKFQRLKDDTGGGNVTFLENEGAYLPEYNIRMTGLDLDLRYFKHFKQRKMEGGYLKRTLPENDGTKCNILIAHPIYGSCCKHSCGYLGDGLTMSGS